MIKLSLLNLWMLPYAWQYLIFSRRGINREGGLINFLVQKGGLITKEAKKRIYDNAVTDHNVK